MLAPIDELRGCSARSLRQGGAVCLAATAPAGLAASLRYLAAMPGSSERRLTHRGRPELAGTGRRAQLTVRAQTDVAVAGPVTPRSWPGLSVASGILTYLSFSAMCEVSSTLTYLGFPAVCVRV